MHLTDTRDLPPEALTFVVAFAGFVALCVAAYVVYLAYRYRGGKKSLHTERRPHRIKRPRKRKR